MTRAAGHLRAACVAALLPAAAVAQDTCVSAGFDRPLPAAENVTTRYADVPAARFPGRWQEGRIFDYAYRLYPDLTGAVGDPPRMTDWRVIVTCDAEARRCETAPSVGAPALAIAIAGVLGRCLLDDPVTAADFDALLRAPPAPASPSDPAAAAAAAAAAAPGEGQPGRPAASGASPANPDTPTPTAPAGSGDAVPRQSGPRAPSDAPTETARDAPAKTPTGAASSAGDPPAAIPSDPWEPDPSDAAPDRSPLLGPSLQPARPCGVETLPDGPPVLTLQRLLRLAGQDPGPLDGIMGRMTRRALVAQLGPAAADLPIEDAIRRVDLDLCYE